MATDPIGAMLEIAVGSTAKMMTWAALTIATITFAIGVVVGWLVWG